MNQEQIINIVCGVLLIGLILVILICSFRGDKFSNETNETIIFIDNPNCGFSQKMKKLLEEHGMKLGDNNITTKNIMTDGAKLSEKYGIQGTPGFINLKNGKTHMGLVKDVSELHNKLGLSSSNGSNESNGNNSKVINVVVGREGCPYCRKTWKYLEDNNIDFKKIDSNTEKGQELMKQVPEANGVPLCLKMMGNQILDSKVGYTENFY